MRLDELDLPFGPYAHHETYFYYDGPKLYSMYSQRSGQYALVNTIEEGEDTGDTVLLLAVMSPEEFAAFKAGETDMRSTFTSAEQERLVILRLIPEQNVVVSAEPKPEELDDSWLPIKGATLNAKYSR